jgi:hypothetical protein
MLVVAQGVEPVNPNARLAEAINAKRQPARIKPHYILGGNGFAAFEAECRRRSQRNPVWGGRG